MPLPTRPALLAFLFSQDEDCHVWRFELHEPVEQSYWLEVPAYAVAGLDVVATADVVAGLLLKHAPAPMRDVGWSVAWRAVYSHVSLGKL